MSDRTTQLIQLLTALAPVFAIIILLLRQIVASMAPGKKRDAAEFAIQQSDVIVRNLMHEVNDRKNPAKPEAGEWTDEEKARVKAIALRALLDIAEGEIKIVMGPNTTASRHASDLIEASVQAAKSPNSADGPPVPVEVVDDPAILK